MDQQQQIRRRFSHLLTSSIGMCRNKQAADSPIRVSRDPTPTLSLPNRTRKPRLADLFSAESDSNTNNTISSTTRCCEKFDSDKTWSGSEPDRASMSHLSPLEYETCDGEFDDEAPCAAVRLRGREARLRCEEAVDKTTSCHEVVKRSDQETRLRCEEAVDKTTSCDEVVRRRSEGEVRRRCEEAVDKAASCHAVFDDEALKVLVERSDGEFVDKTSPFWQSRSKDYYLKCRPRRSNYPKPEHEYSSDQHSESDIASSLLIELSQPFSKSVYSNVLVNNSINNNIVTRASGISNKLRQRNGRRGTMRRRDRDVVVEGKSMAVAKRSVDPYGDFKRSMVEMIVEEEIFGKEELEELLLRFLGLNSPDHHKIIVLVFIEILEILFSNSSSKK